METKKNKVVYVELETGIDAYQVQAVVVSCGKDIVVTITGGDTPHVGAVAVASPHESLKKDGSLSATASVFCIIRHKDDIPARAAALRLAVAFNTTAVVTVGLHINDATNVDIIKIQDNFNKLVDMIIEKIAKSRMTNGKLKIS
jgi:hypothetical protein